LSRVSARYTKFEQLQDMILSVKDGIVDSERFEGRKFVGDGARVVVVDRDWTDSVLCPSLFRSTEQNAARSGHGEEVVLSVPKVSVLESFHFSSSHPEDS
jgi:hypothetical protein